MGVNLADAQELATLAGQVNASVKAWRAAPLVPGAPGGGATLPVTNPADRRERIGDWQAATPAQGGARDRQRPRVLPGLGRHAGRGARQAARGSGRPDGGPASRS
jgi:hypothetical protein